MSAKPTVRVAARPWVFDFDQGSATMRKLLGNKGANLAEMTRVLGRSRVPGGFTIATTACVEFMRTGGFPPGLDDEIDTAVARLEEDAERRFGAEEDPLLLSVRSGAPVSMPGMLDTVLNLGLNGTSVEGLARASGDAASPGTPTGGSCRCSGRWCAAFPRRRSRIR